MTPNRLRRQWRDGSPALGSFVFSRDASSVEILGHVGFDFAIVDVEHAPLDLVDIGLHVRAAGAVGIAALVRLSAPDPALAGRVLDLGAAGVLVPHYGRDAAGTRAVSRALRYAPRGERPSCSGVRATGHSAIPYADYVRHADEDIVGVALVEDLETIAELPRLLAEAPMDAVMPGPGDLSVSMGLAGQPTHPRVREAVMKIIGTARSAGLRVGMYLNSPEEVDAWREQALDFYVYLFDTKLLAQAYAAAHRTIVARLAEPR